MYYLFGCITPVPTIGGIEAHHNQGMEYIFFYEYTLIDLEDDSVIERGRINQYITNKSNVFQPTRILDSIADNSADVGMYPELPEMRWTGLELFGIGSTFLLILGEVIMLVEYYDLYINKVKHQDGSLVRSGLDLLYLLPLIVLLIVIILIVYKYNIKK